MNKTVKILIGAVVVLVISNILILIFMIYHRPPIAPSPLPDNSRGMFSGHHRNPEIRKELVKFRQKMMELNRPLINKIRTYDQRIYEELLKEQPDEAKLNLYIDSTHMVSKQMRNATIQYFLHNKDSLTHEQKQYLLQNFLKKHVHKPDHKFRNKRKGRRK